MTYRNSNYSAFYVHEPFHESSLGASATRDFVSYNLLRAWKAKDSAFPFNDAHNKNYNVRDGSDWESTLKPRLRERLRNSKNIILFLSSTTKSSRALREEIDYGINVLSLPIIIVYPELKLKSDIIDSSGNFKAQIRILWDRLPVFRDSMNNVPTLHLPYKKELISQSLKDESMMVETKGNNSRFYYKL